MAQTRTEAKRHVIEIGAYNPPYHPNPDLRQSLPEDATVALGDLHGSALKLIEFLYYNHILDLSKEAYDQLFEIYKYFKENTPKIIENINHFDQAGLKKKISEFKDLIASAKINKGPGIRLIGDVLADRGTNDYFTMLLLKKLMDEKIPLEEYLSNHTIEALQAFREYIANPTDSLITIFKIDRFPVHGQSQWASFTNLAYFFDAGLIDRKEVVDIYNQYKKHIKLIGYHLDQTTTPNTFYIYRHGVVKSTKDNIQALAKYFNIPYQARTVQEFIATIDAINDYFSKNFDAVLDKFKKETDGVPDYELFDHPLYQLIWGKYDWYPKKSEADYKAERVIKFDDGIEILQVQVNGHAGAGKVLADGKEIKGCEQFIVNIDNNFRKHYPPSVDEFAQGKLDYYAAPGKLPVLELAAEAQKEKSPPPPAPSPVMEPKEAPKPSSPQIGPDAQRAAHEVAIKGKEAMKVGLIKNLLGLIKESGYTDQSEEVKPLQRQKMIKLMEDVISKYQGQMIPDEIVAKFLDVAEYFNDTPRFHDEAEKLKKLLTLREEEKKRPSLSRDYVAFVQWVFLNVYDLSKPEDQKKIKDVMTRLSDAELASVLTEPFVEKLYREIIDIAINDYYRGLEKNKNPAGYAACDEVEAILKKPAIARYLSNNDLLKIIHALRIRIQTHLKLTELTPAFYEYIDTLLKPLGKSMDELMKNNTLSSDFIENASILKNYAVVMEKAKKIVLPPPPSSPQLAPAPPILGAVPEKQPAKIAPSHLGIFQALNLDKQKRIDAAQLEAAAKAGAMSDHEVQIDKHAHAVSQNLQGPYALKKEGQGFWVFDAPALPGDPDPFYIIQKNKEKVLQRLIKYTGLPVKDCQELCAALIADNQRPARPDPKAKPKDDKGEVSKFFAKHEKATGVGNPLGQGGFRLCIEPYVQYEKRMREQIGYLKACVTDGPEVLCLAEQPYELSHDKARGDIFKKVMEKHGYVQASTKIEGRDVGIWVKEDCRSSYQNSDTNPALKALADDIEKIFRGCIVQRPGYLAVLVHVDRVDNPDKFIKEFQDLKKKLQDYADKQSPKAQIAIYGDINARLSSSQQAELSKDFKVALVKGQAGKGFATPTCEAYLLANQEVPRLAKQRMPTLEDKQGSLVRFLINFINELSKKEITGRGVEKMKKLMEENSTTPTPIKPEAMLMELKKIAEKELGKPFAGIRRDEHIKNLYKALTELDIKNPEVEKFKQTADPTMQSEEKEEKEERPGMRPQ